MNAIEVSPRGNLRLNRIRRIVKLIRFLTSATIILMIVLGSVFLLGLAGVLSIPAGVKVSFTPAVSYSSPYQIPAFVLVLALLRSGLFFAGALMVFWLLDLFEAAEFFTAKNVQCVKWIGWLVLGDWLAARLLELAAANGLALDPTELAAGLLIVLVAWIMEEGRMIQEEQELTV